jgi:hypothetical protein
LHDERDDDLLNWFHNKIPVGAQGLRPLMVPVPANRLKGAYGIRPYNKIILRLCNAKISINPATFDL